jgi:hypothetical protein
VTFSFDPTRRTIIVQVEIKGPARAWMVELALDTGASDTVIDETWIWAVGYTSADAINQHRVVTAGGVVTVLEVPVLSLGALGQTRTGFPVLAHTFPPGVGHDGVLGLDFLRGNVLTIDFPKAEITLTPGAATP